MKKLLVTMLVVAMSIVMLTGCRDNTEDAEISDVVSEESSESSDVEETDTNDESVNTSEESSEAVEETVMYSADEVDFRQNVMSVSEGDLSVCERVCYSYAWVLFIMN